MTAAPVDTGAVTRWDDRLLLVYRDRYRDLVADEMWDAIATLGDRQRAAIVLRFYEDLPDKEIAELLGCQVPTVRTAIHRGLRALRRVVTP
jgi:RNA polymerase sigma factor (sigma-70 family)